MIKNLLLLSMLMIFFSTTGCRNSKGPTDRPRSSAGTASSTTALPEPVHDSPTSVEAAVQERRSVRSFSPDPLALSEVSQLLWAAQGITSPEGKRTAPSAGALYPVEIYLAAGQVTDLAPGLYLYDPGVHQLILIREGDLRQDLYQAALQQNAVRDAPAVLILSGVYERTTGKYGERGIRYVHMEIGFSSQNVYLQAESLELGTVFIGAFHDDRIKRMLQFGEGETPLGLMPVGKQLTSD